MARSEDIARLIPLYRQFIATQRALAQQHLQQQKHRTAEGDHDQQRPGQAAALEIMQR